MSAENEIQTANPNPAVDAEELRAALEAAAPRPWVTEHARIFSGEWNHNKHELLMFRGTREWAPDADLIVGAVNSLPVLLDSIDAVLAIHTKSDETVELMLHVDADDSECQDCESGSGHAVYVCDGCWPTWHGMDGHTVWPCPTARACGVTE